MSYCNDTFQLTTRETQVLQLLSEGNTCKQISEILQIAETTVKTYKERMKLKFEVHNCTELVYIAAKLGLV
ncbi:response regulator transcription factor [Bacteroidota bacterium]